MLQRSSASNRIRRFAPILGVAGVAAVAGACGSSGDNGSSGGGSGPITIGVVTPLTGETAIDGSFERNGARLAVNEINAKGGIDGRKISLKIEDGGCDPAATASATQKLVTQSKAVAVEGAFCSSATAAGVQVTERAGVPFISSNSTAADLTERGDKFFSRPAPTDALMAKQVVPILKQRARIGKAALLVFNDDFGLGYKKAYEAELKANGVTVVSSDTFDANTQDFSTFITKILRGGADSLFVAADSGPLATFFKQLSQLGGDKLTKVTVQGAASEEFVSLATPKAAEGIYAPTPWVAADNTPKGTAFTKAYRAAYGKAPESNAAGTYDSIYILADAIKRAGGTDPQALQKAILATNMDAVHGRMTFGSNGQGQSNFFLVQVRNGKLGVVDKLSTAGS